MKKIKFLKDLYDGTLLIFTKDKIYDIAFENDDVYMFAFSDCTDIPIGIEKKLEGKLFVKC